MTDETGWLIEFKPSVSSTPCYYGQTDDDGLGMTANHNAAVRFARKVDAEAVIADTGWTEAFASEHMWCDTPTADYGARLHKLLSGAASRINAART